MAPWGRARKMELLASMAMFSACSRRELGQVAAVAVQGELPEGAVLTRQGQKGGLAYVIGQGEAEVVRDGRRLASLGPGDVVGELSLIDGEPRSATVRALTPLQVLEINADDLRRLLRKAPGVRRKLLEALSERLRKADRLPTSRL
ncbi:MAG TPA: cyclic nucleotide-binding domain-containing protein [Acidimicrobiales bacterium]|nr:cyclic nucleotide-binding domain-containing protein [Acidimicrobiales bacterium]